MPSELIQWFPGHMAKTRRMMKEMLPQVDAVIEILDARIPISSKNPELHKIVGNKPVLTLFSKSSLADPESTARWKRQYEKEGKHCVFIDSTTGAGINSIPDEIRALLSEKLQRYENKGMTGKTLRVMIAGIPNVGKSSLINRLCGGKRAKVEDRPGVTRDKQWITTKYGIELLDTPGVLWPKFEDQTVGENLAVTGAIPDMPQHLLVFSKSIVFLVPSTTKSLTSQCLFTPKIIISSPIILTELLFNVVDAK